VDGLEKATWLFPNGRDFGSLSLFKISFLSRKKKTEENNKTSPVPLVLKIKQFKYPSVSIPPVKHVVSVIS
jgi:hypothetical protein